MDIDAEHLGIPETDYEASVDMPASEFARLCRDLGALGESVAIEVNKEGVRFTSDGDAATGTVLMKADSRSSVGSSSKDKKMKVKKEEEDTQMDEDASEDDGGVKSENEDEDEEESSSKKRKRSKNSSEKTKGKTKKVRTSDAEDDGDTSGIKIMMSHQVKLTFSLKYLQNFAKSSTLCNRVILSMSNDVPLLVSANMSFHSTVLVITHHASRLHMTLDKGVSGTTWLPKLVMKHKKADRQVIASILHHLTRVWIFTMFVTPSQNN
jgi:proliferating cell nuclear antigen